MQKKTFKCNRNKMLLCNHLLHGNTVNCTVQPKRRKKTKTKKKTQKRTKHNKQRFKIDSVWLQVALSVYSKPEEIKSCITSFCCSLSLTLSQFRVFSVFVYACVWWTNHRLSGRMSGGSEQTALEEKEQLSSTRPWTRLSLDSGIIVPLWKTDKTPLIKVNLPLSAVIPPHTEQ